MVKKNRERVCALKSLKVNAIKEQLLVKMQNIVRMQKDYLESICAGRPPSIVLEDIQHSLLDITPNKEKNSTEDEM